MKEYSDAFVQEFVCYSLPGSTDYYYCEIENIFPSERFDRYTQFDFVISPFNRTKNHSLFLKFSSKEVNKEFQCKCFKNTLETETSREEYTRNFENFMSSIYSKKLQKVVCSRIKNVKSDGLIIHEVYMSLVREYKSAFVFLWNMRDYGTWMGATPELLLKSESNKLKTVALAGTKPLVDNSESVKWTGKEKQEQQIIVDYLKEQFEQNNIRNEISDTYTVKAGRMSHLKTDIYFNRNVELDNLLDIIHPGPAISGYPVKDAIALIEGTEQHDREFYTGFLGPIVDGQMELYINLRSMKMLNDCCSLYMGGGLTRDSKVDEEWDETELKSMTLLSVINKVKI